MFFPSLALSLESREISKTSASEGGFLKKSSQWGGEEVDKWDSERVSNVWRSFEGKVSNCWREFAEGKKRWYETGGVEEREGGLSPVSPFR